MSHWKFLHLSLAAGCLTLSGCSYVAAGATGLGTYQYLKGEHVIDYEYSYDKVWKAVETAAKQLRFEITEQDSDGLNGKITAQRYMGQHVYIEIDRLGMMKTQVKIRLDGLKQKILPDQTPGKLIAEAIGDALKGDIEKPEGAAS